jgi:hypothetical protein
MPVINARYILSIVSRRDLECKFPESIAKTSKNRNQILQNLLRSISTRVECYRLYRQPLSSVEDQFLFEPQHDLHTARNLVLPDISQ